MSAATVAIPEPEPVEEPEEDCLHEWQRLPGTGTDGTQFYKCLF